MAATNQAGAPGGKQGVRRAGRASNPREASRVTQAVIIDAALHEFSLKGYDGSRIDEIAARAGVRKNVLYHHFGNKDDLFVAVLRHTYSVIRQRQEDMQLRLMDPENAMRRLVVATGRIWVQYPEYQRLLMSENLIGGRHAGVLKDIAALYNPLFDTLNILLRKGQDLGVFRPQVDPVDLYISITSLTAHYVNHQHTFEAIFNQPLMSAQRVSQRLDHAAEMIMCYLRAPQTGLDAG